MREDRAKIRREIFAMLALIGQIGLVMIVSILIPTLLFTYIGRHTGISWLAVVGFIMGSVAGVRGVYKLIARYIKNNQRVGDDQYTSQIK